MTASDVLLDSWAWWEVLHASKVGKSLAKRYLDASGGRVHASSLACGEIAAKLHWSGRGEEVAAAIASIRGASVMHDVSWDLAVEAGRLRRELREADPDASLVDAIMLATARREGLVLVSNDRAFQGQPDVRAK